MVLEGGEMHQVAIEFERRHSIAYCFHCSGRILVDNSPELLQDFLNSWREALDIRIDVLEFSVRGVHNNFLLIPLFFPMGYQHTQHGYVILIALIAISVLYAVILTQTGLNLLILFIMALILFILASFSTLQVIVDENHLRIKFGYGIYRKKFPLHEIASAKKVKNRWYYGWGIRVGFWPYMWIYNVSGFDAIEMVMKDGKRYRIGTDQPEELEQAILQSIQ